MGLWSIALSVALAGVDGQAAGGAWHGAYGVATGDPSKPGLLGVIVSDQPIACGAKPAEDAVVLMFSVEASAGARAEPAVVMASKSRRLFAFGVADAALTSLPAAIGEQGTLDVTSAKADGQLDVAGSVKFTLCDLVAPPQAPTSRWETRTLSVGDGGAKVKVAVPVDWQTKADTFGTPTFTGQDGRTTFAVITSCGGSCEDIALEGNLAGWGKAQYGAFKAVVGWKVNVLRDEAAGPSTRVVRYDLDNGLGTTAWLHLARWTPGWNTLVVCKASAPLKHAAILDQVVTACSQASLVTNATQP
jgi:hypothetical protein